MVLSVEQSGNYFQAQNPGRVYYALTKDNPLFFNSVPMLQVERPQWELTYTVEDDMPDNSAWTHPLEADGGAPPITVASMTSYPWGESHRSNKAQWKLTKIMNPYVIESDADFSIYEDRERAKLFTNLEMMGRKILKAIITQTTAPPADQIGSLAANLNGWTNTTPAFTQGFSTGILTQQTVTVGDTLWGFDQTSAGIVADDLYLIDKAIAKVRPRPTAMIVPQRFVDAMVQSYYRRGAQVPEIIFNVQQFESDPIRVPAYSYKGIPMIVVSDADYTSAGHDMVSPSYDIYLIKGADAGDPFSGVSLTFKGNMYADDPAQINVSSPTMSVGMGLNWEKTGRIQSDAGVKDALGRVISGRMQLCVGNPQAVSILSGVQD